MHRYSKLSLLAAAIATAATVAYAANGGMENDAMAIVNAKTSLVQAVTVAEQHTNGKATHAEYEHSKQGWIRAYPVVTPTTSTSHSKGAFVPQVSISALFCPVQATCDPLSAKKCLVCELWV
jgi:hypothetical protein